MSAFPSPQHGERLLAFLKTVGIARVVVEYSGGGDSGNIDSVVCYDVNGKRYNIDAISLEWNSSDGSRWEPHGGWTKLRTKEKLMSLADILKSVCNDALETADIDWYNNDGGQGSLEITFPEGEPYIRVCHETNITSIEEHSFGVGADGEICVAQPEQAGEGDDDAP